MSCTIFDGNLTSKGWITATKGAQVNGWTMHMDDNGQFSIGAVFIDTDTTKQFLFQYIALSQDCLIVKKPEPRYFKVWLVKRDVSTAKPLGNIQVPPDSNPGPMVMSASDGRMFCIGYNEQYNDTTVAKYNYIFYNTSTMESLKVMTSIAPAELDQKGTPPTIKFENGAFQFYSGTKKLVGKEVEFHGTLNVTFEPNKKNEVVIGGPDAPVWPTQTIKLDNGGDDCVDYSIKPNKGNKYYTASYSGAVSPGEKISAQIPPDQGKALSIGKYSEGFTIEVVHGAKGNSFPQNGSITFDLVARTSNAALKTIKPVEFPIAVLGSATKSSQTSTQPTTVTVLLTNESGTDALTIGSIARGNFFKVVKVGDKKTDGTNLNYRLDGGKSVEITLQFTPAGGGEKNQDGNSFGYSEDLKVEITQPAVTSKIPCKGTARAPTIAIKFGNFVYLDKEKTKKALNKIYDGLDGAILVDRPGNIDNLAVANVGEAAVDVEISHDAPVGMEWQYPIDGQISLAKQETQAIFQEVRQTIKRWWLEPQAWWFKPTQDGELSTALIARASCKVDLIGEITDEFLLGFNVKAVRMNASHQWPDKDSAKRIQLPDEHYQPDDGRYHKLQLESLNLAKDEEHWFRLKWTGAPSPMELLGLREINISSPFFDVMYSHNRWRVSVTPAIGSQVYDLGRFYWPTAEIFAVSNENGKGKVVDSADPMYGENLDLSNLIKLSGPHELDDRITECWVRISNPNYDWQGPIRYDIAFDYGGEACVSTSKPVASILYILLKSFYEAIWRVDPPRDPSGRIITLAHWLDGAPVMISNPSRFIKQAAAFLTKPLVVLGLAMVLQRKPIQTLAWTYLSFANLAKAMGLFAEAELWYNKSAVHYLRTGQGENRAVALFGLWDLYNQWGLQGKATWLKSLMDLLYINQEAPMSHLQQQMTAMQNMRGFIK